MVNTRTRVLLHGEGVGVNYAEIVGANLVLIQVRLEGCTLLVAPWRSSSLPSTAR
jgi:hypothetical protein